LSDEEDLGEFLSELDSCIGEGKRGGIGFCLDLAGARPRKSSRKPPLNPPGREKGLGRRKSTGADYCVFKELQNSEKKAEAT
jgi:hypothetical protein